MFRAVDFIMCGGVTPYIRCDCTTEMLASSDIVKTASLTDVANPVHLCPNV